MSEEFKDTYGRNELLRTALTGDLEKFKLLFAQDRDALNKVDNNQDTALHLAAMKGHVAITQFLLDNGANADRQDRFGANALHLASVIGQTNVTRILVPVTDYSVRDIYKRTPLDLAMLKGHARAAEILLKAGANPDEKNVNGDSARDLAQNDDCKALLAAWSLTTEDRRELDNVKKTMHNKAASVAKASSLAKSDKVHSKQSKMSMRS